MVALYIVLALLLIFVLFFAVMLFTKLTLVITINKKGLGIKIKKFNIGFNFKINTKKDPKEVKEKAKKMDDESKVMKKFLDTKNNFMRQKSSIGVALSYMKGKVDLCEVALYGYFGTGNPMSGGIVVGTVYAFLNTVVGFLGNFFNIETQPHINVKLKEKQSICDLNGAFMVKAKPYCVLKALYIYKKSLKKGI